LWRSPPAAGHAAGRIAVLVACVALTAFLAGPARAQGTFFLSWNDCASAPLAAQNLALTCATGDSAALFLSFELSQPVDSVVALQAVVDVQSAASTLPDWWQYAPGGCRYGRLVSSARFPGTSCADFWADQATLDAEPTFTPGEPNGGASQARILVSFAVLSSEPRALSAATRYYAARLSFMDDTSSICAGCGQPACLVLNWIQLGKASGATVSLEAPGANDGNRATWQGSGANCALVPVRRTTWGQLKSLYR
jgi:hypothetical protein